MKIFDWLCLRIRSPTCSRGRICLKRLDILWFLWYCQCKKEGDSMKKLLLPFIIPGMLISCGKSENIEIPMISETVTTVEVSDKSTETVTSCVKKTETLTVTTGSSVIRTETEVKHTKVSIPKEEMREIADIQPITVCDTAPVTSEISVQTETVQTTTTVFTEVTETVKITETSAIYTNATTETTVCITNETTVTQTVTEAFVQEETTEFIENPVPEYTDYEKAKAVYEEISEKVSGTCVQYAYATYEMCQEYGLECYFIWTENRLYGHVANVVKIDGIWYILDVQGEGFLINNDCGFTEIIDENENHIANADIISEVRYN